MQSQELLKQVHLKVSLARTSVLQQLLDAKAAVVPSRCIYSYNSNKAA